MNYNWAINNSLTNRKKKFSEQFPNASYNNIYMYDEENSMQVPYKEYDTGNLYFWDIQTSSWQLYIKSKSNNK